MSKHTPGPWHVCTATHPDLGPIRAVATQEGDGVDCVCIVDQLPGCDESTANALLIAAAPDLLEALKLADATLLGANMNAGVVERKVKAAIAKATGEQA